MAPKSVKPNGRGAAAPKAPKKAATKAKKPAAKKKAQASPKSHYIRNLHNGAGGARVDLDDTRINLRPRGERGDMMIVTEEMTNDPMYQHNIGIIFEEISLEKGKEIISKQQINQQSGPTTMDYITNEKGEKYAQVKATITPSYEAQGVTVAEISPGSDGKNTTNNKDITRAVQPTDHFASPLGPEQVEVPGSTQVAFNPDVMPQGLSMEQAQLFMQTPREQRHLLIQQFQGEAAETYREQLQVSIEPVEQT